MKLLSWNIQWGRGLDGRVDLARIAAVAREYDPDVLCLQEVAVNHPGLPGGAAMNQPEWLAGLFLGYEAAYGVASDLPSGDGGLGGRRQFGNLILSRRPLLHLFRHLLPWPAEAGVPGMQRAAQCVALRQIADAGWRQATCPPAAGDLDPPFAVLPRGAGCILCGDFNAPAGAPEQEALSRPGDAPAFVNAWNVAHPAIPPAPTFGVHERRYVQEAACYDMFYVGENLADKVANLTVDAGTTASDHQPVVLEMR